MSVCGPYLKRRFLRTRNASAFQKLLTIAQRRQPFQTDQFPRQGQNIFQGRRHVPLAKVLNERRSFPSQRVAKLILNGVKITTVESLAQKYCGCQEFGK